MVRTHIHTHIYIYIVHFQIRNARIQFTWDKQWQSGTRKYQKRDDVRARRKHARESDAHDGDGASAHRATRSTAQHLNLSQFDRPFWLLHNALIRTIVGLREVSEYFSSIASVASVRSSARCFLPTVTNGELSRRSGPAGPTA